MSFARFLRRQVRTSPNPRRRRASRVVRLEPLEPLECRRLLATIVVNTTADDATADATLSLREAIEVSDGTLAVSSLSVQEQGQVTGAVGSTNTIGFNLATTDPGYDSTTGVWTISVQSALPAIVTNAAIIDGYSQPGSSKNTLATGDNAKLAIAIDGGGPSKGTIDGLTIDQPGSQVFGLDIEDFGGTGVVVAGDGSIQVAGCFIGTDPTGEVAAPNGTGVAIENSSNTIGGATVGDRDVISGNAAPGEGDGVYLPTPALNPLNIVPTGNLVETCYIGVDAAGAKAIANGQAGVADFGTGNTYGGTAPGVGNVISGNAADGLKLTGSITIEGNFVGTDASGNVALGNGPAGFGITNQGEGNTAISTIVSFNLVSGNKQSGINLSPGSQSLLTYSVMSNEIGTNASGTAALSNAGSGLILESVENATVSDNIISANTIGIQLTGFGPDNEHNVFQGNLIGTNAAGTSGLPNTFAGLVLTTAIGNTFGGTGPNEGNVIAFNGGDAISITGGGQDQITQNSIFDNPGAGIKLSQGANAFPAVPVLSYATATGKLSGTLTASPSSSYVVEIFSSPTPQAVGHEQGETFVQAVTVATDPSGQGNFSLTLPVGIYTATSTGANGNTSTFSAQAGAVALAATTTAVSSSSNPSTAGASVTFTATVAATSSPGTPTGTVVFTVNGQAEPPVALAVIGGGDEATYSTLTLAAGPHTVSAAYGGNASFAASTGSLPTQTVSAPIPGTSTTTVTSSANPTNVGNPVTFTAVVAAPGASGTPTGTVTFTIDGQAGTPASLSVVGGLDEATFTTSTLAVGGHAVSAAYGGDASFGPSSGTLPTQTVDPQSPVVSTTTVSSSVNPSTAGDSVTFTAIVQVQGIPGTPTGTVTFTIDGQAGTPVPLSVVGGVDQATFTTSTLTVRAHPVSAAYSGGGSVDPSDGSLPTQTVDAASPSATTTTVTSSANPSAAGAPVTFTAIVAAPGSPGTPTGMVTFTIDGHAEPPSALSVVGGVDEATFTTSALAVGRTRCRRRMAAMRPLAPAVRPCRFRPSMRTRPRRPTRS